VGLSVNFINSIINLKIKCVKNVFISFLSWNIYIYIYIVVALKASNLSDSLLGEHLINTLKLLFSSYHIENIFYKKNKITLKKFFPFTQHKNP